MLDQLIEFVSKHYVTVSVFVFLVVLLIFHESRRAGRNLTSREMTNLINSGEAVVLDIRPQKEFSAGHVVDALHIPADKLKERMGELDKYRDKTIVVVCATGMSAGASCTELKKAGFKPARLSGGIAGWRADGFPTVKK